MLADDEEIAKKFVGGTVYQAFLDIEDYHRWRAPVSGKIIRAEVFPGTYYIPPDSDTEEDGPDDSPSSWLPQAAARAVIYIQSDDPKIGLMCFIGVGMIEASSCEITVPVGTNVNTGDALGMFHFGGSAHILIFGPQATITLAENVFVNQHIKVNSAIAQVS